MDSIYQVLYRTETKLKDHPLEDRKEVSRICYDIKNFLFFSQDTNHPPFQTFVNKLILKLEQIRVSDENLKRFINSDN